MSATVEIKKFQSEDQKAVVELIDSIMKQEFHEDQGAYPIQDIESIEKSYGKIGDVFFVAKSQGKVIGTVAIKKEDERTGLLRRLFVAASHRKKRIGEMLIDRALQYCREVGYQELVFKTTSRMKGAIQLCSKKGFVQRAKLDLGEIELLRYTLSL